MSYLENIIGLTGTTPAPKTGVMLVNDLPIISESFVNGIAKKDEEDLINDVWTRIIRNAETRLEQDIYNQLMKEERFRLSMARTHDFYQGSGTRNASERWEGARFQCQKQEYTKLKIQSVYVSGTGSFIVKGFDLNSGLILFTLDAVSITGEGFIEVNKEIALNKLTNDILIAVDASNATLGAIDGNQGFFFDSCISGYDVTVNSGYINDAQEKKATNFVQSSCFVHVVAEIVSDMNSFCSKNYDLFRVCAWHLAGSMLLNESLTSDRVNLWTNTNRIVRQDESIINEQLYKQYLAKCVQPVMMRLWPTNILKTKDAIEKDGISTGDLLFGVYESSSRYGFTINDLPA